MSDFYLGEVRAFSFNFEPTGWLPCDGRLMRIMDNQALYSLVGNTYGGDGNQTFALPKISTMATAESGVGLGYCIAVQGVYPPRSS